MPTAPFIVLCQDNIAKIEYYFTFDGTPTQHIKSISQISRNSDLSAGDVIITLDNTGADFDYLYADETYLHKIGYIQLGFAGEIEVLNLFTGTLERVKFLDNDAVVELTFKDKFSRFLESVVGSNETPLELGDQSNTLASDIVWYILTHYGDPTLDDTESTSNTDIDYTSWLAWSGIMLNGGAALDPYYIRTYLTGQSIKSVLQKICDLTESVIWIGGDGLVKFTHPLIATTGQAYTQSNIINRVLELSTDERIGYYEAWYGYDPATDEWTDKVPQYSATYGTLGFDPSYIEQDRAIWHVASGGATRFIDESDVRIGYPSRRFEIITGLTGYLDDIGYKVTNQHNIGDVTLNNVIIEEISFNCDEGTANLKGYWKYA